MQTVKAKEKEMKDEKEAERQVSNLGGPTMECFETNRRIQAKVQAIKDKRAAKAEKERYQKLAEKMHRKRVERLKRREKRNKMLKS